MSTHGTPDPATPQSTTPNIVELLQRMEQRIMTGLESRLGALRVEMEQRHEYLNGKINRSRNAEQNLREQADRDQQQRRVDPLPPSPRW